MPIKESLEKVKEYEAYIILGHGNLEIHEDDSNLFIKVPNNLIVMLTSNDIDTVMYANDEIKFYENVANNEHYIQESLLVNNEDLDKCHYLKNKAIYMPGSCIPNFYLDLEKEEEDSYGIFNANDLEIKDNILSPDKIVYKHLIQNNIRLSKILRDMNKGHKKILFINICYPLYFPDDTIEKKYTHIVFSEEFVKFLRECQLDSLEKFTKKFTYFKKDEIPEYLAAKFHDERHEYYDYENENKIRNKKLLKDVSKYLSTLPSSKSNSVVDRRYKSYSNSISSNLDKIDDDEYSSNKLVNESLSRKFNKMLSKNIKKILPVPKSVRTKLRKFNQSLRKKTSTKRKRKSSSSSHIRNSSPKNLRRSKRIRINSKKM